MLYELKVATDFGIHFLCGVPPIEKNHVQALEIHPSPLEVDNLRCIGAVGYFGVSMG